MDPIEIIRNYRGTDAEMTATARVVHGLMVGDLAKFTAFDSTITAPYATLFLTAINNADTVIADSAVIDMQVQKTEAIQGAMDDAKGKYADVKYFSQKAFPTSTATQNEFGLNDYERARKSPTQMIQFLDEMHRACVKYQTQLVAKGFSVAAIAEIQTIRTKLRTTNTDQGVFKKQRPTLTADRITVLNNCYAYISEVNAAAQRVYKKDFAKSNQFVYSSSSADATLDFNGEVGANSVVTAGTVPFAAETIFTFKNVGLVPLVFCLSTTTAFEGIEVAIGGGATVNKVASELNPNATNILVKNTGTTVGLYEIEVDN
jgi:hypothetical protein